MRRDLKALAAGGHATIVHGGAVLLALDEPRVEARPVGRSPEKARMAVAAARLVAEGATILIDSGASTLHLARELRRVRSLTVVTNSLGVATLLARADKCVHMLPGEISLVDEAALGAETIEALSNYRFDAAFVCVGGLSGTSGMTDVSRLAAQFRSRLLLATDKPYILADSSQFDTETPFPIANTERVAGLICDAKPKGSLARWLAKRRIRLVLG